MLLKFTRGALIGATALAAFGWAAIGPASATMVTPAPVGGNGEPGLYTIMNNLYGAGNWTQFDDSLVQTATNNGTQTLGVTYTARYAADNSTFGIWKDGTTFNPLMTVTNAGAQPSYVLITPSMLSTNPGGIYSPGLRDDTTGISYRSNDAKNPDGLPHLIEFQITNMTNTFVMAWEDELGGGDRDYNDLILQYVVDFNPKPPPAQVPEPITVSLLGASLLLVGGARRYLKTKPSA